MPHEHEDASDTVAGGLSRIDVPVAGMTCAGCANTLQLGLAKVAGVSHVDADLDDDRVTIHGTQLDETRLRAVIEELGYTVGIGIQDTARRAGWLRPAAIAASVALVLGMGTVAFQMSSGAYFAAGALQQLNALFSEVSVATVGIALLFGLAVDRKSVV